jgi:N-acetylmuramoyl-L-alanine amidase
MKIKNHLLEAEKPAEKITHKKTPNQGGVITPKYLIIHYTAGRSAASSINWFMNPTAKASAHLVIGMDGSITQMAPFNKKTYHAGVSKWAGINGLNEHSIGIELDNPGKLKQVGTKWEAWFGGAYPASKVIVANHKNSNTPAGWHIYTQAQLDACIEVSHLIFSHYKLLDVLGHEDISPQRKEDPGPAFPMESFRSKVMGRMDDLAPIYKVTVNGARLRGGPGTNFEILGTLKKDVKVEFIRNSMDWFLVELLEPATGIIEPEGWIHQSLVTKV